MSNRKRKHDVSPTAGDLDDHLLHIQAYEADIRCSPTSARSLEANGPHAGEALIKHPAGDSEIWLDRCVRYTPLLPNPVRSACSRAAIDILLTSAFGLSRVLPYLSPLLPWRDPYLPVVYQIRCTPHLGFAIHLSRAKRTAATIPIWVVRYPFGYRGHFLLLSDGSRRLPSR